jgi:ribosomal protein S18 acetylase RimI-like enzyme
VQPELFLVAELDKRVVGTVMAGFDGHRGWLYLVGVHPEFQRHGIGQALVNAAVELLRDLGCWKVNLQVRESNLEVREFYERLGFKDDKVIGMGLRLDDHPANEHCE